MKAHDPHKWMDDTHWTMERDGDDSENSDGLLPEPEPEPVQRDLFN